jgi:aminoglycoside 6'-N-acetyltransferase I
MKIRAVAPGDRDEWLRLRSELWPDHPEDHPREIDLFFQGQLEEPAAVLVAEDGDRLIGLAELSIRAYAEGCSNPNVGYLEGWYVEPEHRRMGLGRALIEASERWARGQGCTEFASDTTVDNESSYRAHMACGFADAGLIRCFIKPL